jgi:hypothetical protein
LNFLNDESRKRDFYLKARYGIGNDATEGSKANTKTNKQTNKQTTNLFKMELIVFRGTDEQPFRHQPSMGHSDGCCPADLWLMLQRAAVALLADCSESEHEESI